MPPLGGPSAGTAYISVLPDTTKLGPTLRRDLTTATRSGGLRRGVQVPVNPDTKTFGKRLNAGIMGPLKGAAGAFAGIFAAQAVVGGLKSAITAASDFGETVSKNKQVFRGNAAEMEKPRPSGTCSRP